MKVALLPLPEKLFLPQSAGEFVSYDLASETVVTLRFERGSDQVVTHLTFLHPGGSASARRVP